MRRVRNIPDRADEAEATARGAAADALLEVRGLSVRFGGIVALDAVSFAVPRASVCGLIGPNGAGKTTLLKTISGIMDPLRGTITFCGQEIAGLDPARIVENGLCHVPEGREVFPLLTVHENLLMGAYTRSDRDAVARDLERAYGYFPILAERRDQDAGLLSGGQQQMLAIARALLSAPKMILMDEPSLGLSPKLTREIFDIIIRINRESGTSILLVEQNAHMALHTADYGYVLENGRVVLEDSCARLREKDDIREFYLGLKQQGVRGDRRWKKKKTWR